jgi:hypothetical protein
MQADRWRDRHDEAKTYHSQFCKLPKNEFKNKTYYNREGIIVLPSVVPVCELTEQMTKNPKSKIIPAHNHNVLVNLYIGAELKQGPYTKTVTSYLIKIQNISNSIEIKSMSLNLI